MRFKLLLLLCSACLLFNFCSSDDEQSGDGISDETISSHTALVYIVADNSLDGYVSMDMEEMTEGYAEVTDTAHYKLLVYVDDYSKPYLLKFRKEYNRSTGSTEVVADTVATYREQNSLKADVMSGVINQALASGEADSYGLVLWSHGNGWLPGTAEETTTRAFGEDLDNNPDGEGFYMDILNLRQALEACPRFEYIMFDACMMQGIEVAYELRNCADYFIASPVEIPGYGAYYTDVVPAFFTGTNKAEAVTRAYFDYYNDLYNYTGSTVNLPGGSLPGLLGSAFWIPGIGGGYFPGNGSGSYTYGLSISLLASDGLENLASATKEILTTYIQDSRTVGTSGVYCYDDNLYNYYYDLKSFIASLNGTDSYYTAWEEAFDDAVPMYLTTEYTYSTFANMGLGGMTGMNGSSGVSTYIPANANFTDGYFWLAYQRVYPGSVASIKEHQNDLNEYYQGFSWYEASGWNETGW